MSLNEMNHYLSKLGCKVEQDDDDVLICVPPTWRPDLLREEDLIEEVGRIHGYDRIPEAMPVGSTPVGGSHDLDAFCTIIRQRLLQCGIHQTVSHTLIAPHPLDVPGVVPVQLQNPHSPDHGQLRTSKLPNLCENALRNGGNGLALFEIGRVFQGNKEFTGLSIIYTGNQLKPDWDQAKSSVPDFFTLKGVLMELAKATRRPMPIAIPTQSDARFHPTRVATCEPGVFGQIHPDFADDLGLPHETVMADFNLDKWFALPVELPTQGSIHKHPAVRRDISMLVPHQTDFALIEQSLMASCGQVLEKQWLFDVYEGDNLPTGTKSLGVALQFRKQGNFTDEEANQIRDAAVEALKALGVTLR